MTSRLFRAYCRLVLRHPMFWLAAVGALHMVGPQGLVTLLGQRGFSVTQVVPAPAAPR